MHLAEGGAVCFCDCFMMLSITCLDNLSISFLSYTVKDICVVLFELFVVLNGLMFQYVLMNLLFRVCIHVLRHTSLFQPVKPKKINSQVDPGPLSLELFLRMLCSQRQAK